jgi:glycosyltransferase involved in cell wall biosynthesis
MIPFANADRLAIFTICSNNYLPMARVFFASARLHHPTAAFFLCLVDHPMPPLSRYDDMGRIVTLDQLAIENLAEFTFRYDVMELNTAAKPFMFNHLFDDLGFGLVLYFDPDIVLYAPLTKVLVDLDRGASLVLTPHINRPSEMPGVVTDQLFMRAGVYNLGFLAASRCDETSDIMHWWARSLRYHCINDLQSGLFVDQKFMDLAPGFAPHVSISFDPTLNVAYWNIAQRHVTKGPEGWTVNGHPLVFFHFSGFDPSKPDQLSRHAPLEALPSDPALAQLIADYVDSLCNAGLGTEPTPPYAFAHFASGVPIPACVRSMFRTEHPAYPDNPFTTYEAMLHLPSPHVTVAASPFIVTNLIRFLYTSTPWLRSSFDLSRPEQIRGLVTWFIQHAARAFGLDPRLISPVTARIGQTSPLRILRRPGPEEADVTTIGYLRTTSGVGQAARMTLAALAQCPNLRSEGLDVALNVVAARGEDSSADHLVERGTGRFQIFQVNADQLPEVGDAIRDRLTSDAYRIAVPFWELEQLPDAWLHAFDGIDEIWAPSRFIQSMLVRSLDKPVIYMPTALPPLLPLPFGREGFGLPRHAFLFFFAFDFLSYPERKNPMGALAAFAMAFPSGGPAAVGLVIKTSNAALAPEAFARLQDAVAEDPRILLLDRTLSRDDMTRLTCACDVVLSLHRSEGFGLLVAEAMLLGKPVIATDYGATTELLTPETGYAVQYRSIAVRDGDYPHAAGQIWADPDLSHAAWLMQKLQADPKACAGRIAAARIRIRSGYSLGASAARQQARLARLDSLAA